MANDDVREEAGDVTAPPIAPPVKVMGFPVDVKPSTWPTAIGIIAIIFGVLGILGGFCGVAWSFVGNALMSMVPNNGSIKAVQEAQANGMGMMIVVAVLSTGAAVLLLVSGIGVYRRKESGPKLIKIWAGVKVLVMVVSGFVNVQIQQATMGAVAQSNPNMPGMPAGFMAGSMCIGIVWGLALPVFVLIWFSLKKIKAETADWS